MICVGEGGEVRIDVSPDLSRRQLTVIGSRTFSTIGQAECTRFIIERGMDVDALFGMDRQLTRDQDACRLQEPILFCPRSACSACTGHSDGARGDGACISAVR